MDKEFKEITENDIDLVMLTQNLKEVINQNKTDQRFLDHVKGGIIHYMNEYKKSEHVADPISAVYSLLLHAQNEINEFVNNKKEISCTKSPKGCSFCCYINVDVAYEEAILALKYSEEKNIIIDKEILEKQAKAENYNLLDYKSRACVFLQNNECSIYEYRPLACRKHFVVSDISNCNTEDGVKGTLSIIDTNSEIIATALYSSLEGERFSRMLIKAMNDDKVKNLDLSS